MQKGEGKCGTYLFITYIDHRPKNVSNPTDYSLKMS